MVFTLSDFVGRVIVNVEKGAKNVDLKIVSYLLKFIDDAIVLVKQVKESTLVIIDIVRKEKQKCATQFRQFLEQLYDSSLKVLETIKTELSKISNPLHDLVNDLECMTCATS